MYGLIIKGFIALCITSFVSYKLLTSQTSLLEIKSNVVQKMTTSITDDLARAMPLIHEAGYKVFAIQAQLSLPPQVNAIFELDHVVDPEKQQIILKALKENAIGTLVLESLINSFARNKNLDQELNVTLSFSGVAKNGVDFTAQKVIVIPEGELSKEFTLKAIDDPFKEGDELFAVKIASINGPTFMKKYSVQDKGGIVYTTIVDEPKPKDADDQSLLLTLTGAKQMSESGKPKYFELKLSQKAQEDMNITLAYSGTALLGEDFDAPKSILVKKGTNSTKFDIQAKNDIFKEGKEELLIKIASVDESAFEDIRYKKSEWQTSIHDEAKATQGVRLTLEAQKSGQEGANLRYTLSLEQAPLLDTKVTLGVVSNDVAQEDSQETVLIKKGEKSASFDLPISNDNILEEKSYVKLKILKVQGSGFEKVDIQKSATQTAIRDDASVADAAHLSITTQESLPLVENAKSVKVYLQSSQVLKEDLHAILSYSGEAQNGEDYVASKNITIKKGDTKVDLGLKLLNDNIKEHRENFQISIKSATNGGLEKFIYDKALDLSIEDKANADPVGVANLTLKGDSYVSEGKTAKYILKSSQPVNKTLVIHLSYAGSSAKEGVDFAAPAQLSIRKGQTSTHLTIQTIDDDEVENLENINITITSVEGGDFENIAISKLAHTTKITDEKDIARAFKSIISKKKIIFSSGSTSLESDSMDALKEIAKLLQEFPKARLSIEGHTNNLGKSEKNLKLSQQRAQSVKEYLVELGVASKRMKAIGYGESRPLVKKNDPNALEINKRVEFKVKY